MRIGIEAQRLFRRKKHGMEVVALELIKHLQLIDKSNQYFIFVKDGDDPDCIQETANFKIVVLKSLTYADWEQYHLPRVVAKYQVDFLHCTSNTAPIKLKVPLIVTIHDLIYLEGLTFGGSAYQNFGNIYRRLVVPMIAKNAAQIITVSEFERNNIIKTLKIPEKKITTIYNAKRIEFRKIDDECQLSLVRKKYDLPHDFLFFFGNTAPRKNTLGVLKAYSDYINTSNKVIPLVITSLDLPEVLTLLKTNKIQIKEAEKYIRCIGYVDKVDLPSIYNLATIFLYPSFREGFGLPIIEAMSCETPVITSNVSSMPEVAGNAAILVDPNNPEDLLAAIVKLTNNSLDNNSLILKGRDRARQFEWKSTAEKTLDIYKKLYSTIESK